MERGRLAESECKQQFSVAYVHALTAMAGLAIEVRKVDYFGVDFEILDGAIRMDVQMKGMNAANPSRRISYDLGVLSYNELADPDRTSPGYLFVLEMPPNWDDWAHQTAAELTLRH